MPMLGVQSQCSLVRCHWQAYWASARAGQNLAQLPVDAKVGKLLLLGASLGCLAPALTIGACLSYKTPFAAPFDQQDAALRAKQGFAAAGATLKSSLRATWGLHGCAQLGGRVLDC